MNPQAIILSPGPGRSDDAGICLDLIRRFAGNVPILGVCLGHQAICQAFGGKIVSKSNLFKGIKSRFTDARYHSLTADPDSLPSELKVTAQDVDDQEIMAVENSDKSIYGVQFHPESIMTEDGKKIIENFLEA
ncbi:anthranilate synthase component II [Ligilactobacillus ruminis SPM0211]|uniref:Anthranilate synthase component II n=1 Tax=Ligilactobacillus ruminis SPM0211 TaxID=1040964 RepID=F7QXA5_9LACO|nr:gamma-glutamyl-gamma-aminobutyrate hydrolase family protein [Ligilactobacillus ruminis]EGM53666.1 anthranilate synthase component II [Ligilactobacillus ruminis SPM0211]